MANPIERRPAQSGRFLTEDNTYVNIADMVAGINSNGIQIAGLPIEILSFQDTQLALVTEEYSITGAKQIEIYCEVGYIRIRTDGVSCTSTTGEPLGAGFCGLWQTDVISVYFVEESVITVVGR